MSVPDVLSAIARLDFLWVSLVSVLSIANLLVMYALDSPRSRGGMVARTLGYMAMICGSFAWKWPPECSMHGLGSIALPLLLMSFLTLNIQYWYECRLRKKQIARPATEGTVAHLVTAIVRNHDDIRPQSRRAPSR